MLTMKARIQRVECTKTQLTVTLRIGSYDENNLPKGGNQLYTVAIEPGADPVQRMGDATADIENSYGFLVDLAGIDVPAIHNATWTPEEIAAAAEALQQQQ